MKNNRLIIRASVAALAFLAFLVCGTVSSSSVISRNKTLSPNRALVSKKSALDPTTYAEISNTQLMPKIVSYTGTSLSRHLNVQFESQVINAYAASSKDVFYVIDDARYTGERNNPFNTDVPDKTLNGFVYRASASSSQTTMYISNTISYDFTQKQKTGARACAFPRGGPFGGGPFGRGRGRVRGRQRPGGSRRGAGRAVLCRAARICRVPCEQAPGLRSRDLPRGGDAFAHYRSLRR